MSLFQKWSLNHVHDCRPLGRPPWWGGTWTTPSTTRRWPPLGSTSLSRRWWWTEVQWSSRSGKSEQIQEQTIFDENFKIPATHCTLHTAQVLALYCFSQNSLNASSESILYMFRDTAGQERFAPIGSMYYHGAKAVIFTYDITQVTVVILLIFEVRSSIVQVSWWFC